MLFTQYYLSIHWIKESKKQLSEMFACLSLFPTKRRNFKKET